jgi:hypothetical protein
MYGGSMRRRIPAQAPRCSLVTWLCTSAANSRWSRVEPPIIILYSKWTGGAYVGATRPCSLSGEKMYGGSETDG